MRPRALPYRLGAVLLTLGTIFALTGQASAVETDQFLTWDLELRDSAEAVNQFFNTEVESFLEQRTKPRLRDCECPELAEDLFFHFFRKRRTSIFKTFLRASDGVQLYPDRSLSAREYRSMSIYRNYTFPYVIPLARTVRVGDIYFGIDKFGHMFGFGSRYYERYRRYLKRGATEEEAIERVMRYGIFQEQWLVGGYLDGVFAYADLEANYQGFRLSRDLCHGDDPYLARKGERWELVRPIDMRDYITPGFDESYNLPHWWADRKREVLAILQAEYADKLHSPAVQQRFERYRQYPTSLSQQLVAEHFLKKGIQPQIDQSYIAFDAPPYGGTPPSTD